MPSNRKWLEGILHLYWVYSILFLLHFHRAIGCSVTLDRISESSNRSSGLYFPFAKYIQNERSSSGRRIAFRYSSTCAFAAGRSKRSALRKTGDRSVFIFCADIFPIEIKMLWDIFRCYCRIKHDALFENSFL